MIKRLIQYRRAGEFLYDLILSEGRQEIKEQLAFEIQQLTLSQEQVSPRP